MCRLNLVKQRRRTQRPHRDVNLRFAPAHAAEPQFNSVGRLKKGKCRSVAVCC